MNLVKKPSYLSEDRVVFRGVCLFRSLTLQILVHNKLKAGLSGYICFGRQEEKEENCQSHSLNA